MGEDEVMEITITLAHAFPYAPSYNFKDPTMQS